MNDKQIQKLRAEAKARRDQTIAAAERDYSDDIAAIDRITGFSGKIRSKRNVHIRFVRSGKTSASGSVSVADAIRTIIRTIEPAKIFSIKTMLKQLPIQCPQVGDVSRHTVASALRRLAEAENAPIVVVKHGSGRRPTMYKRNEERGASAQRAAQ